MRGEALRETLEAARRRHRLPALGAALADPSGAAEVAVVGTRVRGGADLARSDARWHIGSCAKAMTASLYARLTDGGGAAWGAAVPDLFPELRPAMDPGWRTITIDQVLTHRAGLPANLPTAALRAAMEDTNPIVEQRAAAAAEALAQPPRSPGAFRYSNLGYIVAGAAIERLTGWSWEDALRRELLVPLGIGSAGFGAPAGSSPWGHATRWHGLGRGPAVEPCRGGRANPEADNPPVMGPAGRVHLTFADWARFVGQFLDGGAGVLRPDAIAAMLTVPPGRGAAQSMGWAFPRRPGGGGIAFGQQGSNRMWVATALVAPDRRRAALVVTNDGRTALLRATGRLAARLLSAA